jgi:hypothetical protein
MLLIAQAIPYVAFAGAGLLVGWVIVDVVRARLRTPRLSGPKSPDYDRGLADRPVPLSTRLKAQPLHEPAQPDIPEVADTLLNIPTSQARPLDEEESVDPAEEAEYQAPQGDPVEFVPEVATGTELEVEGADVASIEYNEDEETVVRDPSVRVYDAIVAASERRSV